MGTAALNVVPMNGGYVKHLPMLNLCGLWATSDVERSWLSLSNAIFYVASYARPMRGNNLFDYEVGSQKQTALPTPIPVAPNRHLIQVRYHET